MNAIHRYMLFISFGNIANFWNRFNIDIKTVLASCRLFNFLHTYLCILVFLGDTWNKRTFFFAIFMDLLTTFFVGHFVRSYYVHTLCVMCTHILTYVYNIFLLAVEQQTKWFSDFFAIVYESFLLINQHTLVCLILSVCKSLWSSRNFWRKTTESR